VTVAYAGTLFGCLWPCDFHRTQTWYVLMTWSAVMARTFSYHVGLLLTLVLLWAVRRRARRLIVAGLPLWLVTLGPGAWTFVPRASPDGGSASGDAATIRVMTANLYESNRTPDALADEILAADADLLLMQEYTFAWHERLAPLLTPRYTHERHALRDDPFALAIYSRFPFAGDVQTRLPLAPGLTLPNMRAVIEVRGRRIAVYNLHLCPAKLMFFAKWQLRQIAGLLDAVRAESLPLIVAGDFNFTDDSPCGRAMQRAGLADAYDQGGYARGDTWPVLTTWQRWLPGVRIDHVYLRGGPRCVRAWTGDGAGSDHRPVVVELAVDEPRVPIR
jgi:vancomycin resistance protein VanJ